MTWTKLTKTASPVVTGVRVRITSAGYVSPRLIIRIDRKTGEEGGLQVDATSRIDAFIGDGVHAGCMRITADPNGGFPCYLPGKGALKIVINPLPALAPREWPTTPCAVTFKDGLTFKLPWHVKPAQREIAEDKTPEAPAAKRPADKIMAGLNEAMSIRKPEPSTAFVAENSLAAHPSKIDGDKQPPANPLPRQIADMLADIDDKPVNGSARGHIYQDSAPAEAAMTFSHNGKSVAVEPREHAVMTRLYKARGKGFLDFNILSRAAGVRDIEVLHLIMTTVTVKAERIDLFVGVKKKLGYWMKEA